jgi:hypothetical protein
VGQVRGFYSAITVSGAALNRSNIENASAKTFRSSGG